MEKATMNPKRKWKMMLCVLLVLILVFGVGIFIVPRIGTREKLIYVATTGDDVTGKGTSGNPYRTIKKAAEMATPGTIVLVRPGTYIEEDIRPNVSGTKDAMIVFRPENDSDIGSVIIKHNDTFTGSTITPMEKRLWLMDMGWKEDQVQHYTDADIEYSIAGNKNKLTDVFNLFERDYIQIEGFVFKDYKYARNTINIKGTGNVVINNRFENIGCVYSSPWHWVGSSAYRGDVTIPVFGTLNVVRNNYFQSVYGETLSYDGSSQDNIITENTFIGTIGKNSDYEGSESSTLGGRFENNRNNAFAFNYSGGSVNGGTIWLDVCVRDFVALRNVSHNTAYFVLNESGCERNWFYENIVYNKPLDSDKRMPEDSEYFTDFPAQYIENGLFSAFWDTGSTWNSKWVNNVTYNVKNGIRLDRTWRDEVRNNIAYEDENGQHNANDTAGLLIRETAVNGFHEWHGINLKGGGPHIIRNNLWYSDIKTKYVRYMEPSQPAIEVDAFNAQIESTTELGVDPMFTDAAAGDFTLKDNSPAKGTGDNGVDRGAYAVYPKTDVGYNKNLGLLENVNVSFSELNSSAKPGEIISIELTLNKRAKKTMTFEVTPVAGDAQINKDFIFLDSQTVTFKAGESKKTVRIEILDGYDLDQLLALRIQPTGDTKLEAVGPRNLHLLKIKRVTTRVLTINNVGDSMGHSIVEYHKPGETITVDAKTREGYTFDSWETGYHDVKLEDYDINGTSITFVMPDRDITLRADWTPSGTVVNVTGISLSSNNLSLKIGDESTIEATVSPSNATDKVVLWTSSNPLVASVDVNGVVTALSEGTAEIIARTLEDSDTQFTAKCKVTVAE